MAADIYDLRRMVEAAGGYRGPTVYFDQDPVTGALRFYKPGVPPSPTAIQCTTPPWVPGRTYPDHVTVTVGAHSFELQNPGSLYSGLCGNQCDAVFWSESSWEKFLRPYYVRLYDESAFDAMWDAAVKSKPPAPVALALIHFPTSEYMMLPVPNPGGPPQKCPPQPAGPLPGPGPVRGPKPGTTLPAPTVSPGVAFFYQYGSEVGVASFTDFVALVRSHQEQADARRTTKGKGKAPAPKRPKK